MTHLLFLVATTAFAADRVATPISALPDRAPTAPAEVSAKAPPAPASVASIQPLLRARHTADLPDRAALDHHPEAEQALQWLAQYGDSLVEAERAAMLLAHYNSAATSAVCTSLLESPGHAKIRAGAARCLAKQSAPAAEPALARALTDADVRVGVAAADALVLRPGAVHKLDAEVVQGLSKVVQEHLHPE